MAECDQRPRMSIRIPGDISRLADQAGRNLGLEDAAALLHNKAPAYFCGKRRPNKADRQASEILCRARDEIIALKSKGE